MNVFLYGPSGTGKSTVGKLLAESLALPWFDMDSEIEKESGHSVETLFGSLGEAAFRDMETAALKKIISENASSVVSLGGGALLREQNRQMAEGSGRVVLLSGSLETLLSRLSADSYVRPLVQEDPRQRLTDMLAKRREHYASFGRAVETDGKTPQQVAEEVQIQAGVFHVTGMGKPYDVLIRAGSLDELGSAVRQRGLNGPAALVSDENVAPLYAERALASLAKAGIEATGIVIPAGEQHKTIETVTRMWEGFLKAGVERNSVVIALGGGVTGDMAGFAAATFLRGVPWVNVPTTLLSMVDSGLGGKTGADLPQGKNLIGVFHAPSLVFSDPAVLSTLPPDELRSGLAETLKHGIIADPELYQLCKNRWPQDIDEVTNLVSRAVAVKVNVIRVDPFEKGLRQALNLGHTAGHGIEKASDYRLSHGECVAIGMVVETRLAEAIGLAQPGLTQEITAALSKLGLPVEIPAGLDRQAILDAMQLDKKRSKKQVHFALPESIGKVKTGVIIEDWQRLIQL